MSALGRPATEAARWDARLRSPSCTAADRTAYARWRDEPENAVAVARLHAALALLGSGRAEPVATVADDRAAGRWRAPAVAAAIAVAVLSVAAGVLWPARVPEQLLAAPPAAARPLRLADGSLVEMAPGSALAVRDARRVTLLRGRARFTVKPDEQRPFVVNAADRRVIAAGTVFGVELAPGHVLVRLQRGSARVHCWHGLLPSEVTLRGGQQLDAEIGSDRAHMMPVPKA